VVSLAALGVMFVLGNGDDSDEAGGTRWSLPGQLGTGELAVHDEQVCSTSREDELFCVQARSGGTVFSLPLPGAATAPTLAGETLVVGVDAPDGQGDLYGYALDGRPLWQTPEIQNVAVDDASLARPNLPAVEQIVAVPLTGQAGMPGGVVGIDATSGLEVWRALDSGELSGPMGEVLTDGQRFYAMAATGTDERVVVALDAASGAELWRYGITAPAGTPRFLVGTAPVADGSAVAVALGGEPAGNVVVLDAASGATRWETAVTGSDAAIIYAEGVTVISDVANIRGFDDNGGVLWTREAPGSGVRGNFAYTTVPELVVERDIVYSLGFHVFEVDVASGTFQQVHPRAWATDIAVTGDHLVVASAELVGVPLEGNTNQSASGDG